jgi:hypothetical protein
MHVFGQMTCKSLVKWANYQIEIMETGPSQNDPESGPRKSCKMDFLRRARKKRVPRKRERQREDRKIKWFNSMLVKSVGK